MHTRIGRLDLLSLLLQLVCIATTGCGALQVGYYGAACPDAEAIVRQVMERQLYNDQTIGPAIIRMLFHDCFVRVTSQSHACMRVISYD